MPGRNAYSSAEMIKPWEWGLLTLTGAMGGGTLGFVTVAWAIVLIDAAAVTFLVAGPTVGTAVGLGIGFLAGYPFAGRVLVPSERQQRPAARHDLQPRDTHVEFEG